jgi:hypothetical protein
MTKPKWHYLIFLSAFLSLVLFGSFLGRPRLFDVQAATKPENALGGANKQSVESSSSIKSWVDSESLKYGINPDLSNCLVGHESQWVPSKKGDDGNSRGLWQVSNIWHHEVSNAVAFDVRSSTDWSLAWIKKGHVRQWSTFSEYCLNYPVFLPK